MSRARWLALGSAIGLSFVLLRGGHPAVATGSEAVDASRATAGWVDLRVALEPVTDVFEQPVLLVGAGDASGDRYVVEQRGSIWRMGADASVADTPLLDISARVHYQHERGMLGLAFHPQFKDNGRFFVSYTRRPDSATVLSEFTLPDKLQQDGEDPPRPVEETERTLLVLAQPSHFHKGGMLQFDAAGMLLFGVGDGGGQERSGLDPASLLGKLLRLDVDTGWPYGLAPDNGFAGVPGAHPEIHAIGLRNPWRFSIDRASGALFIGDVGDVAWEEIDVLPPNSPGVSFGWGDMEGDGCYAERACMPSEHASPAFAYAHVDGDAGYCAVVGGYVYRGAAGALPDGLYLFSDYCSGTIWGVSADGLLAGTALPTVVGRLDQALGQVLSFGEDDAGELYLLSNEGDIMHIVSDPGVPPNA